MGDRPIQRDFLNQVNQYLDKSLSMDEEQKFLIEMRKDPMLKDMVNKEQTFRNFIKDNVPRRKFSPDLIEGIMRKIDTTS